MVRIRLRRVGARHQPTYRIVAADKESPRDGRFLENLGFYNPRTEPATVELKEDRLFHWLQNGAQPSDSVVSVLKSMGAWDRWERLKQGEELDKLLEEAESSKVSVDPRTRRDDLAHTRKSKKKKKAKVEEEEAPAEEKTSPAEEEVEQTEEATAEPAVESEKAEPEGEPEAEEESPQMEESADDPEDELEPQEEEPSEESEAADEQEQDSTEVEEEEDPEASPEEEGSEEQEE